MPELNRYGRRAMEHWKTQLPQEYLAIPETDRQAWFAALGEQIETAVTRRAQELIDQQEPETTMGFKARYALLITLRHDAERQSWRRCCPPQRQGIRPGANPVPASLAGRPRPVRRSCADRREPDGAGHPAGAPRREPPGYRAGAAGSRPLVRLRRRPGHLRPRPRGSRRGTCPARGADHPRRVPGPAPHDPERPLHRTPATCGPIWAALSQLGFTAGRGPGAWLRIGQLHRLRAARSPS